MHARRFMLAIPDERGQPRRGEVLLAERWQAEFAEATPQAGSNFLIVILGRPAPPSARVSMPAVAVCSPSRPVDTPLAVREPPAIYTVPGRAVESAFPIFSSEDMASYAEGRVLSAATSRITVQRVFPRRKGAPRLDVLVRALLDKPGEREGDPDTGRFLAALASALNAPAIPPADSIDMDSQVNRLRKLLGQVDAKLAQTGSDETVALSRIVEEVRSLSEGDDPVARAIELFVEPLPFAEAVFLCRCVVRDPASALELADMRAYLDAAVIPDATGDLAVDRRVTLEQLSLAALFVEPHRFDGMRATFEFFRKRFIAAYREHHRRYWEECGRLLQQLEESEATARAVSRLNDLRELGKPVGLNALAQFQDMLSLSPCPLDEALSESLQKTPACPMCAINLANEPPGPAAADVSRRLERALRQQQQRLSNAAIRQILARQKEERLEQFLQVVQASDLRGLADVLDDELVAFLRQLLSKPAQPAVSLLADLLRAHPHIDESSLEAAVAEFRRLLEAEIAAQRLSDPEKRPRVVLDSQAKSKLRE